MSLQEEPIPSDSELDDKLEDIYLTAAFFSEVPWSIVAAASGVATEHGTLSPFDATARKVKLPAVTPAIEHPTNRDEFGRGPFLALPALGVRSNPQRHARSAAAYARVLRRLARVEFGDDYKDALVRPFDHRPQWERVIAQMPVRWEPNKVTVDPATPEPDTPATSCVPPDGVYPSAAIGDTIRCVAKQRGVEKVTIRTVDGDVTGAAAVDQLVDEAVSVSWAWSQHGRAACVPDALYAGVFPLAADTANRCDPENNIAAAAETLIGRAVSERPTGPIGDGYEWASMPWVFGPTDVFLTEGFPQKAELSERCVALIREAVDATPEMWAEVPADDAAHIYEDLWAEHPLSPLASRDECGNPTDWYAALETSGAVTADTPAEDALASWISTQAQPTAAEPGVTAVVGRLSNPQIQTPVAPLSTPTATQTGDTDPGPMDSATAASYARLVMDRAAKYSGLDVCGAAQTSGATPTGVSVAGISPTVAAAYLNASKLIFQERGAIVPPEVIAGIGKIESGHATYRGAVVSPTGDVTPKILGPRLSMADRDNGANDGEPGGEKALGPGQFLNGSWYGWTQPKAQTAAGEVGPTGYGRDGNGDGKKDPHNVFDTYYATAVHLVESAGTNDLSTEAAQRRGIFGYNHSQKYVADVMGAAAQLKGLFPTQQPASPTSPETTIAGGSTTPTPPAATPATVVVVTSLPDTNPFVAQLRAEQPSTRIVAGIVDQPAAVAAVQTAATGGPIKVVVVAGWAATADQITALKPSAPSTERVVWVSGAPETPATQDVEVVGWGKLVANDPTLAEADRFSPTTKGAAALLGFLRPQLGVAATVALTSSCSTGTVGAATISIGTSDGNVQTATVNGPAGTITVAAELAPNLQALLDAAAADGVMLGGWGHRSTQRQIELRRINGCPADLNAPSSQCRVPTAPPGKSMHERGLAIDFTQGGRTLSRGTAGFAWLSGNAARFGLYNFPKEAWHWSVNGK